LHFEGVDRKVSNKTPLPEGPCLAVVFEVRVEIPAKPNGVNTMQTDFILTRRRLTASTQGIFSTPNPQLVSNTNVFPEIDRLYRSFVDAVVAGNAAVFQTSELECRDLEVSEDGKCERDVAEPVVTNEKVTLLRGSMADGRIVRLSGGYAFARAAGTLVRMHLGFDAAPSLEIEEEPRGP
jgi:hypothetical protein